jgi:hypothetical protein
MKKLFTSELFVVANIISFIALFLAQFVLLMSENYRPVEDLIFIKVIMWIMLVNFVSLIISIGLAESESRK